MSRHDRVGIAIETGRHARRLPDRERLCDRQIGRYGVGSDGSSSVEAAVFFFQRHPLICDPLIDGRARKPLTDAPHLGVFAVPCRWHGSYIVGTWIVVFHAISR